jgi:outer membrane protein OmpA-like peptidoglycan-associated protein
MNWKTLSTIGLILSASAVAWNCSSAENKAPVEEEIAPPAPAVTQKSAPVVEIDPIAEYNQTLKDYRYPDGKRRKGFSYKKADVLKEDFNAWASTNYKIIQEALDKLPAEYVLEIKGHADASGPESEEGPKKGNNYYSQIRAEAVKEALVKKGLPGNRITTVAAGSKETIVGVPGKDEINRRVTFQLAKKSN